LAAPQKKLKTDLTNLSAICELFRPLRRGQHALLVEESKNQTDSTPRTIRMYMVAARINESPMKIH
jgi:hypothetical protein